MSILGLKPRGRMLKVLKESFRFVFSFPLHPLLSHSSSLIYSLSRLFLHATFTPRLTPRLADRRRSRIGRSIRKRHRCRNSNSVGHLERNDSHLHHGHTDKVHRSVWGSGPGRENKPRSSWVVTLLSALPPVPMSSSTRWGWNGIIIGVHSLYFTLLRSLRRSTLRR